MDTLKFLILCPVAELKVHLCKTHFQINPLWRWTERNKLQFHHSTGLNENEENKQSNTTCQHCNMHHLRFANAYYSHSRFSICSFHTLCRYKARQGGAQSGGLALQHLMLYLQLPSGTGEHDEGFNNCFLLCLETQQYSKPEACKYISNGKCFLYKMHSIFHMLLIYL